MTFLSKLLFNGVGEVSQEFLSQQITITKTHGSFIKMLGYALLIKAPLAQTYEYIYKQLLFIYPKTPVIIKMFIANLFSSPLGSLAYYFALGMSLEQKSYFQKYKKLFIYTSVIIPPLLRYITEKTVPYKYRKKFVYALFLAYNFYINLHFKRIEGNKNFKKFNNNGKSQINPENTNKRSIKNHKNDLWKNDINISLLFGWILNSINYIKDKNSIDSNNSSLDSNSGLSLKYLNNKSFQEAIQNSKNYKKLVDNYNLILKEFDNNVTNSLSNSTSNISLYNISTPKLLNSKPFINTNINDDHTISNNINVNTN
ncbi:hypothetical protein H8356DRAFT_1008477, partial [Neocallimastix lanati (nom. inval.)]